MNKKINGYYLNNKLVYKYKIVPEEVMQQFKPKNVDFKVDEFEEIILTDIYRNDQRTLEKINRDVSLTFKNWIVTKVKKKENISLNFKGGTRTGKSLSAIGVGDFIISAYEKDFDINKMVCANQQEYRQKLKDSVFGDFLQIDENAFANVGMGSHTEMQQLKDVQNIIAKKNIHTAYITPRVFLQTNATLGLSSWGRDTKNWLSRFLLYDLRSSINPLLGYIIIDVGKLFHKYGCLIFKQLGGCTNPNKILFNDINKTNLEYTSCIPDKYNKSDLIKDFTKGCPFYNICKHPLCSYEHKKDKWIDKEMKGGMDDRVRERYLTCIELLPKLSFYDEKENKLVLDARDGKQLKIKINLYIGTISNTKYTQAEIDEILVMLRSLCKLSFMQETCKQLEIDYDEQLKKIEPTKK